MSLFIFKPHDEWTYMGGAYVIIAPDRKTAYALLVTDYDDGLKVDGDDWVLVEAFPVADQETRIVLADYNYA